MFLLPQAVRSRLPEYHLAWFISDVVDVLDLGATVDDYLHLFGGQPVLSSIHDGEAADLRLLRRLA